MDFARKILQNYGWKEGDGLGKNKHGIAKPLKASLKFDNAGFGADQAADDFNNHWWERVFNEATTNVNVGLEGEKVKMTLKDEDNSVEISTKGYSIKKLKKLKKNSGEEKGDKASYENFLRAATLTNLGGEVENADKIDTHDIEVSKVKILSDEELFKACGGRTAHKGARHGLKLSGKLSRIEQQEAELLAKMMANRKSFVNDKLSGNNLEKLPEECNNQNEKDTKEHKLKKKKRKHSEKTPNEAESNSELITVKNKKKKLFSHDEKTPNVNPLLSKDKHGETFFLEKSNRNNNLDCLEEKNKHKKKKNKKEKHLK